MAAPSVANATDLRTDFALLIGGELAGSERSLDVINPATGAVFARCPAASQAQLERAVTSARGAFGAWSRLSFEERAAAKEQMLSNIRESSQQDRRVYVGNLSYDVKWHHLKDFMRQG